MIFNKHSGIQGLHAFLSPSQYHWINYSDEKLLHRFTASEAARRGTRIHDWAAEAIRLGFNQPRSKKTVSQYINDCIGFRMTPEQPLFYSENCFGTADAIAFRSKKLRISDLKNGITQAGMTQLKVYAALFCLEYRVKPHDISIELRIYQSNAVKFELADPDEIVHIMDKIVTFDNMIREFRKEAEL